jgi:hypothetical protein
MNDDFPYRMHDQPQPTDEEHRGLNGLSRARSTGNEEPRAAAGGPSVTTFVPSAAQPKEPLRINQSSRFYIGISGVDLPLVRMLGNPTDVAVLRNRGISSLANFLYGSTVLSIGGDALFGTPGWFNPLFLGLGIGVGFLNLCMDRFLTLRGLYHAGKRELVRTGVTLDVGAEEVSWYSALLVRTGAAVAYSGIVGTVVCQTVFFSATADQLDKSAAEAKAPVITRHAQVIDARIDAARQTAKRDADDLADIRKLETGLRQQDVSNTRQAARQTAKQQARSGLEATRQLTVTNLQAYEAKTAAAEKKAQSSDKAYADLAHDRNEMLNKAARSDPEYIATPHDPLSRLAALRELARQNDFVAVGIVIVELLGVCLEFWVVVLAFAQCPMQLAVSLYCEHMKRTTAAARDLASSINVPATDVVRHASTDPDVQASDVSSEMLTTIDAPSTSPESQPVLSSSPTATPLHDAPSVPRRRRGRPPKSGLAPALNGATPAVDGDQND